MKTKLYLASCAALTDSALFDSLSRTLPAARREKLGRIRHEGARRLSLGAGLLLVRALADEGLCAADYAEDERGRPFLPSLPGFHFSLSHSGETAMCAVSDRPLGCDVEELCRDGARIAERFFHEEEKAWLRALPEKDRPEGFCRLWTLKESYLKALGLGLSLPLDAFAVLPGSPPRLLRAADARPWRFLSFREGEVCCALCAEDADEGVPVIHAVFHAEEEKSP